MLKPNILKLPINKENIVIIIILMFFERIPNSNWLKSSAFHRILNYIDFDQSPKYFGISHILTKGICKCIFIDMPCIAASHCVLCTCMLYTDTVTHMCAYAHVCVCIVGTMFFGKTFQTNVNLFVLCIHHCILIHTSNHCEILHWIEHRIREWCD